MLIFCFVQALRDFFMKCFCKDFNLRTSVVKLRKHVWLNISRGGDAAGKSTGGAGAVSGAATSNGKKDSVHMERVNDIRDVVQTVIDYNSALQGASDNMRK